MRRKHIYITSYQYNIIVRTDNQQLNLKAVEANLADLYEEVNFSLTDNSK